MSADSSSGSINKLIANSEVGFIFFDDEASMLRKLAMKHEDISELPKIESQASLLNHEKQNTADPVDDNPRSASSGYRLSWQDGKPSLDFDEHYYTHLQDKSLDSLEHNYGSVSRTDTAKYIDQPVGKVSECNVKLMEKPADCPAWKCASDNCYYHSLR